MNGKRLTVNHTEAYQNYLRAEERSRGTQEKYRRDIDAFVRWLGGRLVTKEVVVEWKRYLVEQNYAPVTINSMLAALNGLMRFLGWEEYRVKFLKIQRRLFREASRGEVSLKGKIRVIFFPDKLVRKLLKYAKKQKSFPEKFFSPETEKDSIAVRSGRR